MAIVQIIDDDLFSVTRMLLDFCGYGYVEDGEITFKASHEVTLEPCDNVRGPGWLPQTFPKDSEACIQFACRELNHAIFAFKKNGALYFVQEELVKKPAPWMQFPLLSFYYAPWRDSWFLWRRHAMIGKISKEGKVTAYRFSDDIVSEARLLHPDQKFVDAESMVKVLGTTGDKPLSEIDMRREVSEFIDFFKKGPRRDTEIHSRWA